VARANTGLFAEQVLPTLKGVDTGPAVGAALAVGAS
jgi:hypothetical protein